MNCALSNISLTAGVVATGLMVMKDGQPVVTDAGLFAMADAVTDKLRTIAAVFGLDVR